MKICQLCVSPYRSEILKVWDEGYPRKLIYQKYKPLMQYKGLEISFVQMVWRHKRQNHQVKAIVLPTQVEKMARRANLESVVQKLTDLAALKLESMTPEDVKLRDVFGGHKTLIESKKLKLTEDAMTIALGKLFGPANVIDGEVEDVPGRIEGPGDQPADPQ